MPNAAFEALATINIRGYTWGIPRSHQSPTHGLPRHTSCTMSESTCFALITGCSSGIGKELAVAFAARGVTVLATARRTESLDELTSKHTNIEALALELGNLESITRLKDTVLKRTCGRLDYLVNNAGTHYAGTGMDLEMDEVAALFQVNVFAVMRLCQIFAPLLRRSPRGRIVQIGSVTRNIPVVWQGAYNASKAALSQYSKTLRLVSLQPVAQRYRSNCGAGVETARYRGDRNRHRIRPEQHPSSRSLRAGGIGLSSYKKHH